METFAHALTREQCVERLREATVGRIAVTHRALPAIVPVNFTLMGSRLVFRTEPEGMLARACDGTVVAFEVDEVSPDGMSGWSVLVIGTAELLTGSGAIRAAVTGLTSAVGDRAAQFVAVAVGELSGRAMERTEATG